MFLAVILYWAGRIIDQKYSGHRDTAFTLMALGLVSGCCVCVAIPWCVIAWSPTINNIEKAKNDAKREAIVAALNRSDCDILVLANEVGEYNADVRSMKLKRSNAMFKDYVWRFYDEIEEIDLECFEEEEK